MKRSVTLLALVSVLSPLVYPKTPHTAQESAQGAQPAASSTGSAILDDGFSMAANLIGGNRTGAAFAIAKIGARLARKAFVNRKGHGKVGDSGKSSTTPRQVSPKPQE